MDYEDVKEALTGLPRVELNHEDIARMWETMDAALQTQSTRRRARRRYWRIGGLSTAGVLAVLAMDWDVSKHSLTPVTNSTQVSETTLPVVLQPGSPLDVKGSNFRAVAIKSMLHPNRYNMFIYYIGTKAIQTNISFAIGSIKTSAGGGGTIQPGQVVMGYPEFSLPKSTNGLENLKIKIGWYDKLYNPYQDPAARKHFETLDFSNVETDLQVEKMAVYEGGSPNWGFQYEYESVGNGAFQTGIHGSYVLTYLGHDRIHAMSYILKSANGKHTFHDLASGSPGFESLQADFDQSSPESILKGSSASVTFHWNGKAETVALKKLR